MDAREMIEQEAMKSNEQYDYDLQTAMTMVGYNGRVIATVGSSKEKEGNLEYDYSDLPRSFVLVDGAPCKIVLSRISPQGLRLRVEEGYVSSEVGEE